jgi:hypothetical protein
MPDLEAEAATSGSCVTGMCPRDLPEPPWRGRRSMASVLSLLWVNLVWPPTILGIMR